MCIFNLKSMKFVKVNKFLCDLLEYTEDELIDSNLEDLIVKEDLDSSIKVANRNREKLKDENHVNRYITKTGKSVKLNWTFTSGNEDDISYCVALPIND